MEKAICQYTNCIILYFSGFTTRLEKYLNQAVYLILEQMDEETIKLGGSIRLTGFREIDGGSMIIIKKIVGSFVKKISERDPKFQYLSVTLKKIHANPESESTGKFELHATLATDKQYNAEVTHQNLMFAIDKVLKKIESSTE